jgi:3-deoxy-D-arabino-heptulosonate 7-phosphate (DAHP) synthase class II
MVQEKCVIHFRLSPTSLSQAVKIGDHLAGHIEAVKLSRHPVTWVCDPMHGKYAYILDDVKRELSHPKHTYFPQRL